jgi:hypothetical protein
MSFGMFDLRVCAVIADEVLEGEMFGSQDTGPRLAYWYLLKLLSATMIVHQREAGMLLYKYHKIRMYLR